MAARYLPSGVLARKAAVRLTRPYQGLLVKVVLHGWEGWQGFGQYVPAVRAETGNRTRASFVSDLMNREAKRLFGPIRAVGVAEVHGQTVLGFGGGDLLTTFHKIGQDLVPDPRSGRQETIWAQAEARELHNGTLPGLGSGTWARVGYRLDDTETRIAGVQITCATEGIVDWIIELPVPKVASVPTQPIVVSTPPLPTIRPVRKAETTERSSGTP